MSENGQIINFGEVKITVVDNSTLENTERTRKISIGEMHKRRETMADNRRYMIYYTFDSTDESGMMNDERKQTASNSSSGVTDSSPAENV